MPKTSMSSASQVESAEGFEGHYEEMGGYTAGFEKYTSDLDMTEFFKGLPDDRCQSPHWGYVFKGRITYRFPDHEETFSEGEAYYVPPGHTPYIYAGGELVEFSPTDELRKTIEVVTRNMEAGASSEHKAA